LKQNLGKIILEDIIEHKMPLRKVLTIIIFTFHLIPLNAKSPYELKFIQNVSQTNLQQTVRDLVKIGNRLGGTKSGDKSARYIYRKFLLYGYKPVIVEEPEKLTYAHKNWKLKVLKPKKLSGLIKNEWLAGFSPSAICDTARLVFVDNIKEVEEDSIRGNAVLFERHLTEEDYEKFGEINVKCILNYRAGVPTASSDCAIISTLKESANNPMPVFNVPANTGERLKSELEKGKEIIIQYSAVTDIKPGSPKTVIATLQGKSEDYYIVCAHGDSDSGGPGADDNASGVSAVLEIARIFKLLVDSRRLTQPNFSIKFIIWGSECYSSSNFVKKNANELNQILGVINIDEVGIGKGRNCIYFEGNDISYNKELLEVFQEVGENYAGKKGFWKEATTCPNLQAIESRSLINLLRELLGGTQLQGSTDSYVFLPKYQSELGVPKVEIPTITVFTAAWNKPRSMLQTQGWVSRAWNGNPDSVIIDYSPFYHSSLDIPLFTTDKEPANMVWAVNAVGISLIRLLWQ